MSVDATPIRWHDVVTREPESRAQLRERLGSQRDAPDVALWLVRHGETTTNAAGLVTGTTDAPLTVQGRLQAQEAGRTIAGRAFDVAFASQLARSRETLELMTRAGGLEIAHAEVDERLAERSLGELERTAIRPRDPRLAVDLAIVPPGGESYLALTLRSLSFLLDMRELAARLRHPAAVLICTHQGPLRVLAAIIDEISDPAEVRDRRFDNALVFERTLGRLTWPAFAGALSD